MCYPAKETCGRLITSRRSASSLRNHVLCHLEPFWDFRNLVSASGRLASRRSALCANILSYGVPRLVFALFGLCRRLDEGCRASFGVVQQASCRMSSRGSYLLDSESCVGVETFGVPTPVVGHPTSLFGVQVLVLSSFGFLCRRRDDIHRDARRQSTIVVSCGVPRLVFPLF